MNPFPPARNATYLRSTNDEILRANFAQYQAIKARRKKP